ncbi:hypothetical protein C8Q69DRAFT_499124 [Paecilomyces variotii]|uniref:Zn(2)-C6 fungal-type domain-containing protein n=1 Tax=Byssochlamys spectabilis TaxID=264951 RepID=A0A443HR93_BYSSP|nr:hypothetical protein C8Q69DRAFT_499124 [Paecilomyces variotii]KAJ9256875.1 transcriptional regulator family: Fungal Specific TF [Paecilomyces variotii]KAJ9365694.1 transcriptional regulator family: Fungal Specific TF [Paecilomyces variotii]RWQ94336.1 hypothetical protein C8Q69DRAFT_499124 [Paecilomyces variotii]
MTVCGGSKRKRSGRACDRCHRNACRCSPGVEGTVCARCKDQGLECTYDRPVKRRGPNPARRVARESDASSPVPSTQPAPRQPTVAMEDTAGIPAPAPTGASPIQVSPVDGSEAGLSTQLSSIYSAYEGVIPPDTIEALVDVFYHTIYPIRPYFHWPTFRAQISNQLYRSDWGVFVVTMAVCALTAGRLYNGIPSTHNLEGLRSDAVTLSSTCYFAAVRAMPKNLTAITDYCQAMKAHALLASVCLQNGDLRGPITHLGDYSSLSILNGFYTESRWPNNLSEIEKQERRRLFWAVYQQEQYIASNFGLPARQSEANRSVRYPVEVFDDEDITATQINLRQDQISFLQGWNFCSDLYRLLEHIRAAKHMEQQGKTKTTNESSSEIETLIAGVRPPRDFASDSLHFISKAHKDLPPVLKSVKTLTGDLSTDRYSFVAANILFTTQNMKMLIVESEQPSINRCCDIASDLLDELSVVPLEFFQTVSTSSLHHLSHVGQLLSSTIRKPLSAWRYIQVHNILLLLADFLEKIESSRLPSAGLAIKLRTQISAMDSYMQQVSQKNQGPGLLSIGQTLLLGAPDASAAEGIRLPSTTSPSRSVDSARDLQEPRDSPNVSSRLDQVPRLVTASQGTSENNHQPQVHRLGAHSSQQKGQLHASTRLPESLAATQESEPSPTNAFTFALQTANLNSQTEFDFGSGLDGSLFPDLFAESWPGLLK